MINPKTSGSAPSFIVWVVDTYTFVGQSKLLNIYFTYVKCSL